MRIKELKGEMLMNLGRQDRTFPREGRAMVYNALAGRWRPFHPGTSSTASTRFCADEGPRHDPELALKSYGLALELFKRKLGEAI